MTQSNEFVRYTELERITKIGHRQASFGGQGITILFYFIYKKKPPFKSYIFWHLRGILKTEEDLSPMSFKVLRYKKFLLFTNYEACIESYYCLKT